MAAPMARQGDLFANAGATPTAAGPEPELALSREQLLAWQARLAAHQGPLCAQEHPPGSTQGLLFPQQPPAASPTPVLRLLELRSQPLSFWRWPRTGHQGAALYIVTDQPEPLSHPLVLYIGETGRADRRWKGDHDCKAYLAHYSEALRRQKLDVRLSIRFWLDVPEAIRPRRQLEQSLIQHWLPPVNKETRQRWQAPFTALPD
ncbi:MAG: GIY-YIG nuclease family protein [Cyanobacteriota bacterium]